LFAFGSGKVKNPLPRAPLIAGLVLMLVSAKGGVGKSTVTVNLAALKARGKKDRHFRR